MPYLEHPVFEKPDNEDIKIWRYMSFAKFVSLLNTKALFFCRSDKLDDPFEGHLSKTTTLAIKNIDISKLKDEQLKILTFNMEQMTNAVTNQSII